MSRTSIKKIITAESWKREALKIAERDERVRKLMDEGYHIIGLHPVVVARISVEGFNASARSAPVGALIKAKIRIEKIGIVGTVIELAKPASTIGISKRYVVVNLVRGEVVYVGEEPVIAIPPCPSAEGSTGQAARRELRWGDRA